MEDWQEWQLRADQIAAELRAEVDALEQQHFSSEADPAYRRVWTPYKKLKDKIRTAPAIRLEDKLSLERRLRSLGAKAYRGREAAYEQSGERREELLKSIGELRTQVEAAESLRQMRDLRRDLNTVRRGFDEPPPIAPQDRQVLWTAWRETNELLWNKLNDLWNKNQEYLEQLLATAREQASEGKTEQVRTTVRHFFEQLPSRECRQEAMTTLKADADALRKEAQQLAEQRAAQQAAKREQVVVESPLEQWRAELERTTEAATELSAEIASLEQDVEQSRSILDQSVMRGTLVQKRNRLRELERTRRNLEQRIEQAEETPAISTG